MIDRLETHELVVQALEESRRTNPDMTLVQHALDQAEQYTRLTIREHIEGDLLTYGDWTESRVERLPHG